MFENKMVTNIFKQCPNLVAQKQYASCGLSSLSGSPDPMIDGTKLGKKP